MFTLKKPSCRLHKSYKLIFNYRCSIHWNDNRPYSTIVKKKPKGEINFLNFWKWKLVGQYKVFWGILPSLGMVGGSLSACRTCRKVSHLFVVQFAFTQKGPNHLEICRSSNCCLLQGGITRNQIQSGRKYRDRKVFWLCYPDKGLCLLWKPSFKVRLFLHFQIFLLLLICVSLNWHFGPLFFSFTF